VSERATTDNGADESGGLTTVKSARHIVLSHVPAREQEGCRDSADCAYNSGRSTNDW
jgi:hypothetical protein